MSKTVVAVKGSHLTDAQAQVIGEETAAILAGAGVITPRMIVDASSNDSTRLHGFFEWDDAEAADKHRLDQARSLLRSIEVYYQLEPSEESKPLRAMYSVVDEDDERVYVSLDTVIRSDVYREQVIKKAQKEMRSWACKYRQYKELSAVVELIDNM